MKGLPQWLSGLATPNLYSDLSAAKEIARFVEAILNGMFSASAV